MQMFFLTLMLLLPGGGMIADTTTVPRCPTAAELQAQLQLMEKAAKKVHGSYSVALGQCSKVELGADAAARLLGEAEV